MAVISSELYVEPLLVAGSDDHIVKRALVSSQRDPVDYTEKKKKGLINSLMRDRHGSPFEGGYLSFYLFVPRGVRDEHVRHRAGWSYSSTSLRYRMNEPVFYIPPPERPLIPADDHKAMKPHYVKMPDDQYKAYKEALGLGYDSVVLTLDALFELSEATEARRWITTDGLYTPYIAECNPRSLMHFLSLRTDHPEANHPSKPMWEIARVADQMEEVLKEYFPLTHEAYLFHGRECP